MVKIDAEERLIYMIMHKYNILFVISKNNTVERAVMKNIRINVLEAYKLFAETASVVPIQNNHTKGFIILITYPFNKSSLTLESYFCL